MRRTVDDNPQHVLLALWRRDAERTVEFFVPFGVEDYLSTMRFPVTTRGAAATARHVIVERLLLNPRNNARIFNQDALLCVAAFHLTTSEAGRLTEGAWLPAQLFMDPGLALLLQDVAMRL